MTFWRRLFGGAQPPEPPTVESRPETARSGEPPPSEAIVSTFEARLRDPARLPTVLEDLRRATGTPHEGELLDRIVRGLTRHGGTDDLKVACAERLVERGQAARAAEVLEGTSSRAALLLVADLAAERGRLADAVDRIEQLLALDIDHPGARERHERWCRALGRHSEPKRRADVTLVQPTSTRSTFRLLREVARGGAGTIYEAEDPALGRKVAWKLFHRRGEDASAIRSEARQTAAMGGPGVVRLLDADPEAGWIAYEWLPLGSLRDVLARDEGARLAPFERWCLPVSETLARLHGMGFVHGDLKPANVLLAEWDAPLLADFGLSVPLGTLPLAGTPGYLAPERLEGAPATPRDDVYAFGRMLAEVLEASEHRSPRWSELAARCTARATLRPVDGAALVEEIRSIAARE